MFWCFKKRKKRRDAETQRCGDAEEGGAGEGFVWGFGGLFEGFLILAFAGRIIQMSVVMFFMS
jgi:hypothetical protein